MIALVRVNTADALVNPPLGLLYVGDALKKAGYEVKIFHIEEKDIHKCAEDIKKLNPLWAGFSVNTGWSMKASLAMSRQIKDKSAIPVVWGNAHASLLPHQCLQEDSIDYAVIGEGEITAVELSRAIEKKEDLASVAGIAYKDSTGAVVVNPEREFIRNLDSYSMDWSLVDAERFVFPAPEFGMKRAFQFSTSRGCPHKCAFCYNQRMNKRRWRAHSREYAIRELLSLKESLNLDGIRFWDDNFFTNKSRAIGIVQAVDLPYTCEARVDYIDDSFAKILDETGCRMVLLGLESGSNRVLEMICKETGVERNMLALKALNHHPSIAIHPSFIVGFPSETEEEFRETTDCFARMIRTRPNFWFVRLGLYVPYPGCDLYDRAIEEGFHAPHDLEQWDDLRWDTTKTKAISCVPWISNKDDIRKDEEYLQLLHAMTTSRFPYGPLLMLVHMRIKYRFYTFELERALFLAVGFCTKAARSLLQIIMT